MECAPANQPDSPVVCGGAIPGSGGQPAYRLYEAAPSQIPVLIAVPHAGRTYPASLIERMRHPRAAAIRLEDRFVDLLGEAAARETGASLLVANAPRAMIDLNRAADEVDWEMFARGRPDGLGSHAPGFRVRSGLGLIPRRLAGLGELWKQRHDPGDLAARIAQIHAPYHACLADSLARLRQRWGAALLIDLHSMPPLGARDGQPAPQFVVGDRFGASCHGGLSAACFAHFSAARRPAAHNRPYAGGYVLERHARPGDGIHALQLEVDRSCYLDAALCEPGAGLAAMTDVLAGLVRRLAPMVAELGQQAGGQRDGAWPQAAE